ncbi:unnamed protein product, partial [Brachionus calyciflorus]
MSDSVKEILNSFEEKIKILNDDCTILTTSANKLINKIKIDESTNEKMLKAIQKYETIELDIVKLNIGGSRHSVLKSTLTQNIKDKNGKNYPSHMFQLIINGSIKCNYDDSKAIFIDRNPKYFPYILEYLRKVSHN